MSDQTPKHPARSRLLPFVRPSSYRETLITPREPFQRLEPAREPYETIQDSGPPAVDNAACCSELGALARDVAAVKDDIAAIKASVPTSREKIAAFSAVAGIIVTK